MEIGRVDGVDCLTASFSINILIHYHTDTARKEFMTVVALGNFTKLRCSSCGRDSRSLHLSTRNRHGKGGFANIALISD